MEISKDKMKELAHLITKHLKCHCDCDIESSRKESCMCSWTPIEVWFEDNCDIFLDDIDGEGEE